MADTNICIRHAHNILCVFDIFWSNGGCDVNFEVLTSVLMKVQVFWMSFFVVGVTISDVSSDYSASFPGLGSVTPKTYHETGIYMRVIFTCYSCSCKVDCNIQYF